MNWQEFATAHPEWVGPIDVITALLVCLGLMVAFNWRRWGR